MRAAYESAEWPRMAARGTSPGGRPIVALVRDAATRSAIRSAANGVAMVLFCDYTMDLVRIATETGPRLIIAEPRDAGDDATAPALFALRLRSPRLKVLLHLSLTPDDVHDAAGCFPAIVVLRQYDDIGTVLRAELSGSSLAASPGALLDSTAALVPPAVRPFFSCCAWRAHRLRTASDAAIAVKIPIRTLSRRMRDIGLPTPRRVLQWYWLLHAAWHIESGIRKKDAVARRVGLASGAALGATLRHCTGLQWPELRDRVGLGGLLVRFDTLLRQRDPDPPDMERRRREGAARQR